MNVPEYKVLIFNSNRLMRWETIRATDDIAAINAAPVCDEAGKIEIWRADRRLAKIKCMGGPNGAPSSENG